MQTLMQEHRWHILLRDNSDNSAIIQTTLKVELHSNIRPFGTAFRWKYAPCDNSQESDRCVHVGLSHSINIIPVR